MIVMKERYNFFKFIQQFPLFSSYGGIKKKERKRIGGRARLVGTLITYNYSVVNYCNIVIANMCNYEKAKQKIKKKGKNIFANNKRRVDFILRFFALI